MPNRTNRIRDDNFCTSFVHNHRLFLSAPENVVICLVSFPTASAQMLNKPDKKDIFLCDHPAQAKQLDRPDSNSFDFTIEKKLDVTERTYDFVRFSFGE